MVYTEFILRFLFALGASSLVGLEREHSKRVSDRESPPIFGMRSLVLVGVLGFLFTYLTITFSNISILLVGLITVLVISTSTYLASVFSKIKTGSTTYLASISVFFIGVFSGFGGYGNYIIAAAISVITTILLVTGKDFEKWTKKISREEILAAAKIGILSLIILPLIPNRYMGPYDLINPFKVWYIVVAISLIYFISYLLMKHFSKRGLIISSFFSGIMYSSPTTYQLSTLEKDKKISSSYAMSCIFLASFSALMSHLIIITFIFGDIGLLSMIILPYTMSMATLLALSYIFLKTKENPIKQIKGDSPFSLIPVLKFGFLFLLLTLLGGILNVFFGSEGFFITSFTGSLISATTVIASIASLISIGNLTLTNGAFWVIFAAIVSLLVKTIWVGGFKSKRLFKHTFLGFLLASVVMLLTFFLQVGMF